MRTSLLIIVLLAAVSVSAVSLQTDQYIVVVGRDAPASDVVVAANFAASIKGSTGTTFSSAIDTDLYTQLDDLTGKTIVVVDGRSKQVKVLGRGSIADAVKSYFDDQGFDVISITNPVREDVLLATPVNTNPPPPTTPPAPSTPPRVNQTNQTAQVNVTQPFRNEAIVDIRPPPQEIPPDNTANATQDQSAEPQQREGTLSKIWKWFVGLF